MGVLTRLIRKRETRSLDTPGLGWVGLDHQHGGRMGPERAQQLAAVAACVQMISTSIAALPASIYRDAPGGAKIPAPEHPAAALLVRPNGFQTYYKWLVYSLTEMLLHGNSVSQIMVDGRGAAVALMPIPWTSCRVSLQGDGSLLYSVTGAVPASVAGLNTSPQVTVRTFRQDQVLHLKDRPGEYPWLGQSRIYRSSEMFESALAVQDYARYSFNNQAKPSGVFGLPKGVKGEDIRRVEAWFRDQQTRSTVGSPLFMEDGTSWTALSGANDTAQVLQSRQWAVLEVARVYGVPPILIGDVSGSTFTNSVTSNVFFGQNCLRPIIVGLEQAFDRSVIAESGVHLTIDLSGLLRGDYQTASTTLIAEVAAGVTTVDEARLELGYAPHAAADVGRA